MVSLFIVGAIGLLLGVAAHDLGIQALTKDRPLRPWLGTCPRCGFDRGWTQLICPSCSRPVAREPVTVLLTAVVAAGFANTIGISWILIPYLGFLLLTSALLITDLESFRLVDRLNLRGTAVLVVLLLGASLLTGSMEAAIRAGLGGVTYFAGTLLMFVLVRGKGFGAGDVKLSFQLGVFCAFISWGTLGWAVFSTAIMGGLLAIGLLVLGRAKRDTELPYGPPMILGAWLAVTLAGLGAFPV